MITNILYWLIFFISYVVIKKIRFINISKNDRFLSSSIIWSITVIFLLVVIYISYTRTGFRLNFDLLNVYDLREDSRNLNLPTLLSYIFAASKAVNPVLLMYSLLKKRYVLTSVIFGVQLLSFGIDGSKTGLFFTLLVFAIYFINDNNIFNHIPKYSLLVSGVALFEFIIFTSYYIISFIIRRIMYIPALINYYYFDFFIQNEPDFFKQSFLRILGFESKYPRIPNMIGEIYFNDFASSANNGLLSDAMANLGILGILIFPIIVCIILKIFDDTTRGLDSKITFVPSIYIAFILISSFLNATIFTHGFLSLMLIFYFLNRNVKDDDLYEKST